MDMDPHPYDQLHGPAREAAPISSAGPRRVPRIAIGVGLTAFLGMAGAGLAFATSGGGTKVPALSASSGTSTTTSVPGGRDRPPIRGGGAFGGRFGGPAAGAFGGPGGAVVHAQYTTRDGSGFRTIDMQTGQVTKVSGTSITVKSADGYVATYAIQSSTVVDSQSGGISAVTGGDTVSVTALVKGATTTATNVMDTTKIGSSRKGFGFGSGPAQPPGSPAEAPGNPSPA